MKSKPGKQPSHLLVILFLSLTTTLLLPPVLSAEDIGQSPEELETVAINGEPHPVPAQWQGKKITAPVIPLSSFRQIPQEYTKDRTRLFITEKAQTALKQLLEQAAADDILLQVESGYRSVGYQKKIFQRMLSEGRTFDDIVRYVAPPGYSEHALGTAIDFFPSDWQFAKSQEYRWLQENAGTFGFTETYSKTNKHKLPWEAWHWNYTDETDL